MFLVLLLMPLRADDRLNILFVFADDWGRYASAYAKADGKSSLNDVLVTPHIDRVAKEGVLFKHAFVNAPSCTPCRSSMLTGRYFFQTGLGAILNGAKWDSSIPSFPLMLKDAGYHIGKSYKVWSPGTPADAPFGGQQHAYDKAGHLPNHFSSEVTGMVQQGTPLLDAKERVYAQVRGNFDAFLQDAKPNQPWLYFFGPTNTHRKWKKGSGKALWGIEPATLTGKIPAFLPDVPEVREDLADYLGECQAVDAYVGVLLKRLEETGQLERTVIVLSGDHGMPGVSYGKCNLYDHGTAVPLLIRMPGTKQGRIIEDLVRLPDLAPTFLEIAGLKPPSDLYGRSLIPLLRSESAGLVDPTRNWVIVGRERHVDRAREGNLPYPMRGLRTPDFLYIRNFESDRWPMGHPGSLQQGVVPTEEALTENTYAAFADMDSSPTKAWLVAHRDEPAWRRFYEFAFAKRPQEELYDLRVDPQQIHNVAGEERYAAEKKKLSDDLLSKLSAAGDPRIVGRPVSFENPPFTDLQAPGAKRGKK